VIRPEDREVLIGQVAYLVDELHAQEAILSFVPERLWSLGSPSGEHSLLELYGLLVALGERSYPGLLEAWSEDGPGAADSVDEYDLRDAEPWNESTPRALVARAVRARAAVVARLEAMGEDRWAAAKMIDGRPSTLGDVAFRITQNDAAILRRIGELLHEANLGGSPVTRLS
jgi:hypothetical protein